MKIMRRSPRVSTTNERVTAASSEQRYRVSSSLFSVATCQFQRLVSGTLLFFDLVCVCVCVCGGGGGGAVFERLWPCLAERIQ